MPPCNGTIRTYKKTLTYEFGTCAIIELFTLRLRNTELPQKRTSAQRTAASTSAASPRAAARRACVSFAAAAACYKDDLGDKEEPLSDFWRARQLEYSWLRSEMREYVPFWHVTQDALDYTMATLGIQDEKLRQKLLDVYWELNAFPEV